MGRLRRAGLPRDESARKPDGKIWLYAPSGLVDGPLPTHYEPWEGPVANALYQAHPRNPVAKTFNVVGNRYIDPGDPAFPIVISTYRLTEHHLTGAMTRWLYEYSQDNFRRQDHLNRVLFACIEELALENARLRRDLTARLPKP